MSGAQSFASGQRVRHADYGDGTVEQVADWGPICVRFDQPASALPVPDRHLVLIAGCAKRDLSPIPADEFIGVPAHQLAMEVERLRARVTGLLEANNREVEQRRKATFQRDTLKALLDKRPAHCPSHPIYNRWSRHAYEVEISVLMGGEV
jgi:hypothetical protein